MWAKLVCAFLICLPVCVFAVAVSNEDAHYSEQKSILQEDREVFFFFRLMNGSLLWPDFYRSGAREQQHDLIVCPAGEDEGATLYPPTLSA